MPSTTTVSPATAARNLRLALTRYERLAGTPRHLQLPAWGCGWGDLQRMAELAAQRGNLSRSAELLAASKAEARRAALCADWSSGRRGRRAIAWWATAERLGAALQAASDAGAVAPGMWDYCLDRYHDALAKADSAAMAERLN